MPAVSPRQSVPREKPDDSGEATLELGQGARRAGLPTKPEGSKGADSGIGIHGWA